MGSMRNRVAVITGGAQGIGAAIAKRFVDQGAVTVLMDLNADRVKGLARELASNSGQSVGIALDVSEADEVERAFAAVLADHGRVDILVNNAGILRDNLLFRMSETDWDDVLRVHLKGAFLCSRAAQRSMVEANYGRIINLSSIAALGNRGQGNYSAAKAGLQGFTKTLAIELGPFGITVNAIGPGFIETPMTMATAQRQGMTLEALRTMAAAKTPVGRTGTPEDVAVAAEFFASDDASFVTGQVLYVDGGRRLH
jgi:3-oxoacyl-[acyl-carrier protein] reductase